MENELQTQTKRELFDLECCCGNRTNNFGFEITTTIKEEMFCKCIKCGQKDLIDMFIDGN